jgi:hypothetical protein
MEQGSTVFHTWPSTATNEPVKTRCRNLTLLIQREETSALGMMYVTFKKPVLKRVEALYELYSSRRFNRTFQNLSGRKRNGAACVIEPGGIPS